MYFFYAIVSSVVIIDLFVESSSIWKLPFRCYIYILMKTAISVLL